MTRMIETDEILQHAQRAECFMAVAQRLLEAGVPALLLRDDPMRLGELTQIDLLIQEERLDEACARLLRHHWELQDSGLFDPFLRRLVKLEDGVLLRVTLYGQVIEGARIFLNGPSMMQDARQSASGFLLPTPEAWVAYAVLDAVMTGSVVGQRYRDVLAQRIAAGLDQVKLEALTAHHGLSAVFKAALAAGFTAEDAQRAMVPLHRKALSIFQRHLPTWLRRLRLRMIRIFAPFCGWRPGLLIVFIGADRAERARAVEDFISRAGQIGVPLRLVKLEPPERKAQVLLLDKSDALELTEPMAPSFFASLFAVVRRILVQLGMIVGIWGRHLGQVTFRLCKRQIVVADGYPFDLEGRQSTGTGLGHMLAVWFTPTPHVTVLLDNQGTSMQDQLYRLAGEKRRALIIHMADGAGAFVLQEAWRKITRLQRDRIRFWS